MVDHPPVPGVERGCTELVSTQLDDLHDALAAAGDGLPRFLGLLRDGAGGDDRNLRFGVLGQPQQGQRIDALCSADVEAGVGACERAEVRLVGGWPAIPAFEGAG
ncbi:hypothetical protein [Streptomyces sp. Inha503]|uniref:hypothetical protein n=1 Tax=Streptomyces sp. Inha503 TaxID=3383314 RepID=UPI00399F6A45